MFGEPTTWDDTLSFDNTNTSDLFWCETNTCDTIATENTSVSGPVWSENTDWTESIFCDADFKF